MDIVFNELSLFPYAPDIGGLEKNFKNMFLAFKKAKEKYNFNRIALPTDIYIQIVTSTLTFSESISQFQNKEVIGLLLGLCKPPYSDDLEVQEMAEFLNSDYSLEGDDIPTEESPIGLPISYIKSLPSLSIDSHPYWRQNKIPIKKTGENEAENITVYAYNICLEEDIESDEINEWAENSFSLTINSSLSLSKFLDFDKYTVLFEDGFLVQLFNWKEEDENKYKYILRLMRDVQLHPFTGGLGRTENLRYRGKEASKRITIEHRLSYSLNEDKVTFLACKGHYKFH